MAIWNNILNTLADAISKRIADSQEVVIRSIKYRKGDHPRQIRAIPGKADDNLVVNFTELITDRSIANVLGDGVKFDLPGEDDSPEQLFINSLMDANKYQILLQRALTFAADGGTGYFKILPGGAFGKDGNEYNRIVALNPGHVTMESLPDDVEIIYKYVIEYWVHDSITGKERGRREVYEFDMEFGERWNITYYETDANGKWVELESEVWDYDFAPIVHWQNLPNPYEPEGRIELSENMTVLQDRYNFIMSNMSKIIRHFAHPRQYGINLGNSEKLTWGIDEMPTFNGTGIDKPEVVQLDPVGDLEAANQFARDLRQAMFDITRTVDLDSLQDKIGSLTNFGLKVLYSDSIGKTGIKRLLFGEALLELIRRLLVINNFGETDPGVIVWPDFLPQNEQEEIEYLEKDLTNGLVSHETASTKRGYDFTSESEKIAQEGEAQRLAQGNIGGLLLEQFIRGGE